jgi:hypothetical protein
VHTDLTHWLAGLDAAELAGILHRRPDVFVERTPRDLRELADALVGQMAIVEVLAELPLPAVEAIEVLQALEQPEPPPRRPGPRGSGGADHAGRGSGGVGRAAFAALFGRKPDDTQLDGALQMLVQRALVWPSADGDTLYLVSPLRHAFANPLNLGRPAAELFGQLGVPQLRKIAELVGRSPKSTKVEIATDLGRWLATPGNVGRLVESAPAETKRLLHEMAHRGPAVEIMYSTMSVPPEVSWALERGMLALDGWAYAEMPREVALALRGADWRAPFTPAPDAPTLAAVTSTVVSGEAGSAASTLLDQLSALIDGCAANPVALRKTGGVGARESRRLAKAIGVDEPTIRLLLEIAVAAELLDASDEGVLPTAEYDVWAQEEPAARLAIVLSAWWTMPAAPLMSTRDSAAFAVDPFGPLAIDLRPILLRVLDGLPQGYGVADPATLWPLIEWTAPLSLYAVNTPSELIEALWHEFVAVGACAHGAISPLGRALGAEQPIAEVAATLLSPATATARFQADLTAVVAGSPAASLRELLDDCADREARGAASIWRFSPASVRRALDTGMSTVDLLERLRTAAVGATLPQPLEYLVGDVARRHGAVRVRTVGCVVHGDDTALLAELAAARALAALGLTVLAPTVLTSAASPTDTLAALRKAGYAPLGEDASGAVRIERPPRRRLDSPVASGVTRQPRQPTRKSTVDALALAEKLLVRGLPAERAPAERAPAEQAVGQLEIAIVPPQQRSPLDPAQVIAQEATHLSEDEARWLAHAVEEGTPIRISYTDGQGVTTRRVIEPAELNGNVLEAWCRLREDERGFLLERIDSVRPA